MIRLLLLLILIPLPVMANSIDDANALFNQAKYDKALNIYQNLQKNDHNNPNILRNIGNCYAVANQNGIAMLYYRAAQKLAPTDPGINNSIQQLQKSIGLFPTEKSPIEKVFQQIGANGFAALILVSLLGLVITLIFSSKLRERQFWSITILLISISLLSATALTLNIKYQANNYIVINSNKIQISPFAQAEDVAKLNAGSEVTYLKKYGEYSLIEYQGERGWIATNSLRSTNELLGVN